MGREVVKAVVAQDDMVLVGVVDKVGVGGRDWTGLWDQTAGAAD